MKLLLSLALSLYSLNLAAQNTAATDKELTQLEVDWHNAYKFKDSGNPAFLVHLDNGDFVAYSAICTHQGCTVDYKDGNLACPCHGSVFDPANGAAVVAGPAPRPLPEIPVKVEGGVVVKA